jgi:signal transduction histidine kinase
MAKMYGLSAAGEIVGRRLGELLDRTDSSNISYLREFFRSGYRVSDAESHEVDAAGERRYFLNNLVGVLDEGRLVRAWGTQRDITDQRRTEDEIHERNRQLAALNATSAAVSGSLELSSVLSTLKKLLKEQMEIPGGGIYLYDEADDLFYLQAVWGLPDQMVDKLRTYPAAGFYGDQMMLQPDAILSLEFGESSFPLSVGDEGEERQWHSYLRVPLIAKGQIQGIAALIGAKPGLPSAEQVSFFKALGQQVGVAIQNARLFEQVSAARERMQTLSQRLVQVQEAERRHIARELHDQVGQALTGLIFELEVCRRLPPADQDKRITRAQELANELIAQVRNLSLVLRPTILDDLGLLPALLWHFERYTDSTGVRVSFDYTGLERRFPAEVETAAYRVAQEALTNVARHAEVREATVHVWADLDMLCVQVEDRGAGFDAKAAIAKHVSSGVAGMRERALLLGGELNIESAPGKGARLTAEFPLHGVRSSEAPSSLST